MDGLPLLVVLAVGLAFGNTLIAGAAAALLFIEAAGLNSLAAFLEQRALQLGLVLLMIAVLSPLSTRQITMDQVLRALCTWPGLLAIVGGAAATYVNGQGVQLLQARPDIIAGILVGTIIGVFLLRGIPVGPLAAAGITALLLRLVGWK
ncbi:MAG: DUF441 domain-containing protein [Bacillota bacterium]|nr:DUF441 domain-containing protein [Bacillota bacterium]